MSKYTTTVRNICADAADMTDNGFKDVDRCVAAAIPEVFTSTVTFFDPDYRQLILRKLLRHYYMREIGCETVGLWKLWINTRLEEIVPYYNMLWQTIASDFNPLWDTDLTTTYDGSDKGKTGENNSRTIDGNKTSESTTTHNIDTTVTTHNESDGNTGMNSTDTQNSSSTRTPDLISYSLESDTPQGGITGLDSEKYLTRASKDIQTGTEETTTNGSNTTEGKTNYTDSTNGTQTTNGSNVDSTNASEGNKSTDTYTSQGTNDLEKKFVQKVTGRSGKSGIELMKELKELFFSVDMQFIGEFNDLFMGVF